jgi:hypothetical protein
MTDYSHILFNQTPEDLRRIGARGGRAAARNRRAQLRASATPAQEPAPGVDPEAETAAEAMAALDAEFPWLRGAERRAR